MSFKTSDGFTVGKIILLGIYWCDHYHMYVCKKNPTSDNILLYYFAGIGAIQ